MATILVPLPASDFDPTEAAVPWQVWRALGHTLVFATPDGRMGAADPRMVTGDGLGLLAPLLRADANGRQAYDALVQSPEFQNPLAYGQLAATACDALFLPGGHAVGMKPYLESVLVQAKVAAMFEAGRPVGAICHGVLVAARSRNASGRSVLYGRKTTALTRQMELTAWNLTRLWLGDYYRTYPQTVEEEVTQALAQPGDFIQGPPALKRDHPERLDLGFSVRDGNYLSARWPGDAHRLAHDFAELLPGP
ncbi:type 1 glutamine amidotransferase domain-containing protein [Variovorax terrae]|uniref:Type 1 glutamine amidotransferase domain-containing protein n=1 Tax=Variovorax terrae TaxID=2923278 RepID=A0A9X2AME9_9BURK|nr:type 1 glutamine amidotransferase domain-containing protein [Variovorax terrae]MCJ0762695.1 type 1 glutamine amidotransferase domain-containing protein [Variovorax terrae]